MFLRLILVLASVALCFPVNTARSQTGQPIFSTFCKDAQLGTVKLEIYDKRKFAIFPMDTEKDHVKMLDYGPGDDPTLETFNERSICIARQFPFMNPEFKTSLEKNSGINIPRIFKFWNAKGSYLGINRELYPEIRLHQAHWQIELERFMPKYEKYWADIY